MRKPESRRNVFEFFNNPPAPLTRADAFDTLLQILKKPVDTPLDTVGLLAFPKHIPPLIDMINIPTAIKIMESEIFYEGGLKGAANPGGGKSYESHPIQDLPVFILSLAMLLNFSFLVRDPAWKEKQVKEGFDKISSELLLLIPIVRRTKGIRWGNKIENIMQSFKALAQVYHT